MKTDSPLLVPQAAEREFTNLFACISEEEDGYTIQIRLSHRDMPGNSAWGEELADCFETASMLVSALADKFSIQQAGIRIEIRMQRTADGTLH